MLFFECIVFLIFSVFILWFLCDEEPVLDLSDLNLFHVILFTLSLASVLFDNIVKSYFGQNANSDRQVFLYVGFKWASLTLYFGVIWVGFFAHVMTPLLVAGSESSIYVNRLLEFYSNSFLISISMLGLYLLIFEFISFGVGSGLVSGLAALLSILILKEVWFCIWDIIGRGPTQAVSAHSNDASPISQRSSSSLSYSGDSALVGFDWNEVVSKPLMVLFVEVANWFFIVLVLTILLVISCLTLVSLIFEAYDSGRPAQTSYASSLLSFLKSLIWSLSAWLLLCGCFLLALAQRSALTTSWFSWV